MTSSSPSNSIHRRGMMFILSSPSGAGKTTISKRLLTMDERLEISTSVTTRAPRKMEVAGQDYHFVSKEAFADMIMNEEFLEHAKVFDHYYGTPRKFVEQSLDQGQDVLFDIDWQGTRQLKNNARHDLVSVFILPPSIAELERRLRSRAQDSEEIVQKRMAKSADEISHWFEYDYVVVNTDVDKTIAQVHAILQGERVRRKRQIGLEGFVEGLMNEYQHRSGTRS